MYRSRQLALRSTKETTSLNILSWARQKLWQSLWEALTTHTSCSTHKCSYLILHNSLSLTCSHYTKWPAHCGHNKLVLVELFKKIRNKVDMTLESHSFCPLLWYDKILARYKALGVDIIHKCESWADSPLQGPQSGVGCEGSHFWETPTRRTRGERKCQLSTGGNCLGIGGPSVSWLNHQD